MKQELKDYAKSVIANKFTLTGYVSLGLGAVGAYIFTKTNMPEINIYISNTLFFSYSFLTFLGTEFGVETYKAYRKMKNHIQKHNTIESRFKIRFSQDYCVRTGIKLAAKEAGLEDLL